jgi:hypothetical protein
MKQELESMEKNRTWELIDLPTGHRPISLKWVFKLKKDEKGRVTKHKARLVARGFIQQEGIDYNDVSAPVAMPGFAVAEEGKVYRLRKVLYGLRQVPGIWNAKLYATLKEIGFQQSAHEAAVYRRGSRCTILLVGININDLIITDADQEEVECFKAAMKEQFHMSDLGLLCFYLSVEVRQDAKGITLR